MRLPASILHGLFVLLCLAGCDGSSAPNLEMLHAVHKGSFVALVDGGTVLYGLSSSKLHVLSKGPAIAEVKAIAIPPGLSVDSDGNGTLLLAGNTLYGALPSSVFAFDVTDRNEPSLVFQDKACGGASLALDGGRLFVALGGQVTAFDVTDPRGWKLAPGASRLSDPIPTPFIGPSSMALDSARGLIVVAARDSLEVRRASDLSPVAQGSAGSGVSTPVWSVVGIREKAVLVCSTKEGLRSIALGDDGTLGTATVIDPTPCNGTLSGDAAWLGLPHTSEGQTPFLGMFGKINLKSGTLTKFTLSSMQVVDETRVPREPARYGVNAFNGAVENADYTYLDVGDIWVLAPRR